MGKLTQDLIDSLLDDRTTEDIAEPTLSEFEIDALGESINISMGAGAKALSSILGMQVLISTPEVQIIKSSNFEYKNLMPAMGVSIKYIEGLSGVNYFMLQMPDIKKIAAIMMGMTPEEDDGTEPSELEISAISEAMNQMMGASSTALATFFDLKINISTPECEVIEANGNPLENNEISGDVVIVKLRLVMGDIIDSEFVNIMPLRFAKELVEKLIKAQLPPPEEEIPKKTEVPKKQERQEIVKEEKSQNRGRVMSSHENVRLPSFDDFDSDSNKSTSKDSNLNLIMDVPLDVVVQIGKTNKMVKDIIKLTQGSIIELDKQAGDPIDILVNGQLIAKGDVVVIDDNFGVRITEIISKRI